MQTLDTKTASGLLGITVRALQLRAGREKWSFVEKPGKGRGGKIRLYPVDTLPDDIRLLYNKAQLDNDQQRLPAISRAAVPAKTAPAQSLSQREKKQSLTKYDLLRLYRERVRSAPYGTKASAREDFVAAYNTGLLYPQLFEALGSVSWKTLEGWKRDVKSAGNDCFVLADRRGAWKRGLSYIGEQHAKILLACLLHPNKPKIAESIRFAREIMAERGIANGFSEATYRRWIDGWRERNFHIWTFTREGWKAWNDKCALSAERDYDLIEVGDLVVADGHVLNFEIVNPWTGKPKRMTLLLWLDMKSAFPLGWEIMPTENTQAIAAALRWAILRLGKIPKIAYLDNGKAFGAKFFEGCNLEHEAFTGLFERLGMQVIHARPYRGQSKTVERFFGTMSELERWSPTFTGTSIATKPPGMLRGEKLHRRIRTLTAGGGITLEQAHLALADWFDRYVRRPQTDGHLAGRTPLEVFMEGRGQGVDRERLNDLMMAMTLKHVRRSAISMPGGRRYYHPDLHGRTHQVLIRYDLQDPSYIRVHETSGELICVAEPYEKLHPAAKHLGTAEDQQRLADHCAEHRRQERAASSVTSVFLRNEFLPLHRERMAAVGITPLPLIKKGVAPATTPRQLPEKPSISAEQWEEIQASAGQAEVWEPESEPVCDLEELARQARENVVEDAVALRARLEALTEPERYVALLELAAQGRMISERWRDFMRYFENTLEYLENADRYEEQRGLLAVQWQAEASQNYQSSG